MKYPKPKNQPNKNPLFLLTIFFFFKRYIKNKLKVIKFINEKLYGGKLKEVKAPKIVRNNSSR